MELALSMSATRPKSALDRLLSFLAIPSECYKIVVFHRLFLGLGDTVHKVLELNINIVAPSAGRSIC